MDPAQHQRGLVDLLRGEGIAFHGVHGPRERVRSDLRHFHTYVNHLGEYDFSFWKQT